MNDHLPVRFLHAMAQAVATMALYADGHPARERALDAAYGPLADLQAVHPRQRFTFLGDEVVYGTQPLPELRGGRQIAEQQEERRFQIRAVLGQLFDWVSAIAQDATVPVTQLVEQRRKLVESESKRRVQMQDMITSEKAMLLTSALLLTLDLRGAAIFDSARAGFRRAGPGTRGSIAGGNVWPRAGSPTNDPCRR